MKKLLFFGTPDIAVPALEQLASLKEYEIVGVGVFPDKPVGRSQEMKACPVKVSAQSLGLPITEIRNKTDLIQFVKRKNFNLAIVIAFGMIFPEEILRDKKFVNIHFSLLPLYRGASPVQSALLNGDKISGITFQIMAPKLDSGDILWQKSLPLGEKKTSEVFQFFARETADRMTEFLANYFSSKLSPTPQDENKTTFCTKFKKSDGEVFPNKDTAEEIYRKFRAFDIFPGIFVSTRKGNVKLTEVKLTPWDDGSFVLPCAQNTSLFIRKAQIPGKKEMLIAEILKGHSDLFS
ncbi:methionyl-tRNA formyltransferase [Candidatus Gracilibacteria bacterium]|nr:methionyl-tRNA formyltransferase [Candidatus Gracilibacteria bacterium]